MIKGFPLSVTMTAAILGFYIMDFYFMSRHDRNRKQSGKGWAWDYTLMAVGMGILLLLQPVLLPMIGFSTSSVWGVGVQALGGAGILLSFILHIWARRHLLHFYTERVEVQIDHKVIDTGPYALMRHPIITSFFLFSGGLFLVNPAVTTLLTAVYTFWTFTNSAREEEKMLSENVPGYAEYMKHTPRFLPRFWKS